MKGGLHENTNCTNCNFAVENDRYTLFSALNFKDLLYSITFESNKEDIVFFPTTP